VGQIQTRTQRLLPPPPTVSLPVSDQVSFKSQPIGETIDY
jgi:hypothetical protein